MDYPEILLLPLLMFADYFLTVLGAIQREKKHALHFKVENYELNPIWQKSIRQKRWFNPWHTLLTIAVSTYFIWVVEFFGMPTWFSESALGFLLGLYGMIVAKHINNLLLFRYLAGHPNDISGEITMSGELTLTMSMYQTLMVLIPLLLIAELSRNNVVYGAVFAITLLFIVHLRWRRRARRKAAMRPKPPVGAVAAMSQEAPEAVPNSPSMRKRVIFVGLIAVVVGAVGYGFWDRATHSDRGVVMMSLLGPAMLPSQRLTQNLSSNDLDVVRDSLGVLTERKDPIAIQAALPLLKSKDAYIWLNAALYLGALKRTESVPYLIKGLRHNASRAHNECVADLAAITGNNFGMHFDKWQAWWEVTHPFSGFDFDHDLGLSSP